MTDQPNPLARLYINDIPDSRGEGGADGSYEYDTLRKRPVAVSFVGANGRYQRVSFDVRTGDVSVQDLGPEVPPVLPCKCGAPAQAPMGAHRPDCPRGMDPGTRRQRRRGWP